MDQLLKKLKAAGVLHSPTITKAFEANNRAHFVPPDLLEEAYTDAPLPIKAGQTISQPYTVAFMMELLQPGPKQKILDVGFGSGWTTALLAHIVGEGGKVYGLEIVPEVYAFGKTNLEKFGYTNVKLLNQSGWEGLADKAPFDRILVSAAAPETPEALKKQLAAGGRMVIPINQSIKLIKKISGDRFEEEDYPGFAFVPLLKHA